MELKLFKSWLTGSACFLIPHIPFSLLAIDDLGISSPLAEEFVGAIGFYFGPEDLNPLYMPVCLRWPLIVRIPHFPEHCSNLKLLAKFVQGDDALFARFFQMVRWWLIFQLSAFTERISLLSFTLHPVQNNQSFVLNLKVWSLRLNIWNYRVHPDIFRHDVGEAFYVKYQVEF